MSDPVNKHHELATTGHAEGYARGGSVSKHHPESKDHHSGHHDMHVGHGHHGHKGPHEHHHHPGSGETGHGGHEHSVHDLTKQEPHDKRSGTYTHDIETHDGGGEHHRHGESKGGTGGTRNRI